MVFHDAMSQGFFFLVFFLETNKLFAFLGLKAMEGELIKVAQKYDKNS